MADGCVLCDIDTFQWATIAVSDPATHRRAEVSVCIKHYAALFHDFPQNDD